MPLDRKDKKDRIAASVIYQRNGAAFEECQKITTLGARDWESIAIGDEEHTESIFSRVYRLAASR